MEKTELIRRAKFVTDDLNGMNPMHLPFYTLSLEYPVKRGMDAFRRYEISKTINENPNIIFSLAQEGINHAASVSRFLWPSDNSKLGKQGVRLHKGRGDFLRKKFNISDNSPLSERSLRNTFEHFDERLDLYLLEELAGEVFPQAMIESHTISNNPTTKVFKLIDPSSDCMILFNQKFFFGPVIKSLRELEKHYL